jgi:hypothetical protein
MCPLCITTAALTAAGTTTGAGALALVASKWRTCVAGSAGLPEVIQSWRDGST